MKILFFTDSHIRGTNPSNRTDSFVDSLEEKFKEIQLIVEEHKVDYILHGGDLLNRPDISVATMNRFLKIFLEMKRPIYMIGGNHDIYGQNPQTINRTVVSLLNTIGTLKLLFQDDIVVLEKEGLRVQLTGQPYIFGIDGQDRRKYYIPKEIKEDVDFAIHMVHGLLLDKHFIKTVDHTVIDDIKDTPADITLAGHYHTGFGIIRLEDKYFINPGALARVSNSLSEIKRRPQVVLLNLSKEGISSQMLELKSAQPGDQVLDRTKIESAIFKGESLFEFKQIIDQSLELDKLDINDILIQVSTIDKFEDQVKKEALRRIGQVQMRQVDGE